MRLLILEIMFNDNRKFLSKILRFSDSSIMSLYKIFKGLK